MKEKSKEITCVKCGTTMRSGFIVEKDMNELRAVGVGLYWKPVKFGPKALKTVALIAYACPECGYIEQYIKNLEQDREKLD
jgi:predicted nucleic-acid-binding Zn-ribbon protein